MCIFVAAQLMFEYRFVWYRNTFYPLLIILPSSIEKRRKERGFFVDVRILIIITTSFALDLSQATVAMVRLSAIL